MAPLEEDSFSHLSSSNMIPGKCLSDSSLRLLECSLCLLQKFHAAYYQNSESHSIRLSHLLPFLLWSFMVPLGYFFSFPGNFSFWFTVTPNSVSVTILLISTSKQILHLISSSVNFFTFSPTTIIDLVLYSGSITLSSMVTLSATGPPKDSV